MGKLEFKDIEGLKRILEHSKKTAAWQKNFDGVEMKDTFCLVHDHGVYVMSAAEPRDLVRTKRPKVVQLESMLPALEKAGPEGVKRLKETKKMLAKLTKSGDHESETSFAVYAEGCDPSKSEFEDWWETSREMVGGDDFCEYLPLAWIQVCVEAGRPLVVNMGKMSISFRPPKAKVA